MNCLHPIVGVPIAGKIASSSDRVNGFGLPCGKCINCRIAKRAEWAFRCSLELQSFKGVASFVTLTYDDEHLPSDFGLCKKDLQLFIKRLRKFYSDVKIKYFASGEYGDTTKRPHYHLIIFGLPFKNEVFYDRYYVPKNGSYNCRCFCWDKGLCNIGSVSYDSIQYVTGYVEKKFYGDKVQKVYGDKQQPFALISQGIGLSYFQEHYDEIVKRGGFFVNGYFRQIPRYYFRKFGLEENKDYIHRHNEDFESHITFLNSHQMDVWEQRRQRELNLEKQEKIKTKGVL